MKILNQHPNGVALIALKTYDELSPEELDKLSISSDKKVEDFETFIVHRKKTGEIFKVKGYRFSDEYFDKIKNKPDFVDILAVFHNEEDKKAKKRAFKRLKKLNEIVKRTKKA